MPCLNLREEGAFHESELSSGQTGEVVKRILTLIRNVHSDQSDWSSLPGMLGSDVFFFVKIFFHFKIDQSGW